MGVTTGLNPIGTYNAATNKEKVDQLLAIIPNPDATTPGNGAIAGGGNGSTNTYLDEMSPGAAAALIVEITALKAAIANVA